MKTKYIIYFLVIFQLPFISAQDQNATYMLQGNAGVFEACVNALSEPQKLAIRTVLA